VVAVVYLSMGANLGFRRAQLREGLRGLQALGTVLEVSDMIETLPVGPQDQPLYLNLAARLGTELSPLTLLRGVKRIESEVGRRPTYRWGPRILDIDLLTYDDLHWDTPILTLPHPRMEERDFVMTPLRQIRQ
jgi:2-amino-4-hydroxy-6-hydroxymethyldihydropteridine diphosphokinase